jgi:uncharacterized protein YndB with AHSA1/START domain
MTFNSTRMQITLNANPERVFNALTDSSAVRAWFSEHAEIDLNNKQYDFWGKHTPNAPDRSAGKHAIIEYVNGETLTYQWHISGHDTQVTFRLHPHNTGTILTVKHTPVGESDAEPAGYEDFWFLSLENLRRYLDGKASDARIDYTHPMRGTIRHETEIDAPAQRVWEVLTNSDELDRWIATKADVQLEQGGKYSFGWLGPDGTDYSALKILDLKPDEKLVLEHPPYYSEAPTTVTWEMKENNGKTWLTFTHSGFADDQDVAGLFTGWRNFVNWVRSVAEYGAEWNPPILPLSADAIAYAKSIYSGQGQLVEA